MFDFKFDWSPSFEIGIDILDNQHKHLFSIARDIEQLLITKCATADDKYLLSILCDIRDYITYHFYEEEKIMLENNCPDYTSHKQAHDACKQYINSIDYGKLCASPEQELLKIRDHLVFWFFEHILSVDKKLSIYAKK